MNKENKRLIEEYPFLARRNYLGEIIENDKWTYLDEMPEGWKKAFGEKFCKELKTLLEKADYLYDYRVIQVKEKFGELCLYASGVPEEIVEDYNNLIRKYEHLSRFTCINCGKPATHITKGWISPYCTECALKIEHDSNGWEQIEEITKENWYDDYRES